MPPRRLDPRDDRDLVRLRLMEFDSERRRAMKLEPGNRSEGDYETVRGSSSQKLDLVRILL